MMYYVIMFYMYELTKQTVSKDRGRHHCVDEDFYNYQLTLVIGVQYTDCTELRGNML